MSATAGDDAPRPHVGNERDAAHVRVELSRHAAGALRISDIGAPVSRMVDIHPVLFDVLATVVELTGATSGNLMLYDATSDEVSVAASIGFSEAYAEQLGRLHPGEGAAGLALSSRRAVVVEDITADPVFAPYRHLGIEHGFRAVCCVPLVTLGDEPMGVIATYWPHPHRPDPHLVELVDAYAREAADLVARARLHGEARRLASRERSRATQLHELADTALELSAVTSVDELLRVVTESARAIIGAHQAVTSRLYDGWARAATYVSLSEKYADYRGYDDAPEGLGVLNVVTRENRPLRLTREELVSHPEWRGLRDAPGHPPLPTYLAAPLVSADGGNLGLIQLADKLEGDFTAEDESILVQLAQMASAATERLELIDRERAARREAERLARHHQLLSEASKQLSASLELTDAFTAVSALVVPRVAQWCAIDVIDGDGRIERRHVRAADAEIADLLEPYALRRIDQDQRHGAGAAIREGHSLLYPAVPDEIFDGQATGALLRTRHCSSLVVPMRARGAVIGALTLMRVTGEPYTDDDVGLAEELAARAATAIDNAARYGFERNVAETLQRSLLPQALPMTRGITVASRYLPGAQGTAVGGDWYDLIDLGQGRVALVVGDVMGRGVAAASVMGQLRASVRAYALEGHEPAEVLQRVDRVVQAIDETQLTTCIYAVYDTSTRDLTIASAGHLPPLLLDAHGPRFIELEPGLPLGVGGNGFAQSRLPLRPGALLLLYTDGLVEGRDCAIGEGMQRLLEAAKSAPTDPEALCAHLLHALGRDGNHDDDTALLAVGLAPVSADDPHEPTELVLPPAPGSAASARVFVAETLAERGLARHRDVAVLLVSELVTNAFRHARTDVRVKVATTHGRLRVEVIDGSGQVPLPRHAVPDQDESGRGMVLVAGLSDRWGTDVGFGGKCVWFELETS